MEPVHREQRIKEEPRLKRVKRERLSNGKILAHALLAINDIVRDFSISQTDHPVPTLQGNMETLRELMARYKL